jgi:hypothetical protein
MTFSADINTFPARNSTPYTRTLFGRDLSIGACYYTIAALRSASGRAAKEALG